MNRAGVVSGGGTGIGLAMARAFAIPGDQVAILGRREVVLQEAAEHLRAETGASVTAFPGDLSVPPNVERVTSGLLTGEVPGDAGGRGDSPPPRRGSIR